MMLHVSRRFHLKMGWKLVTCFAKDCAHACSQNSCHRCDLECITVSFDSMSIRFKGIDLSNLGECTTRWSNSGNGAAPLGCSLEGTFCLGVLGRPDEVQGCNWMPPERSLIS